MENIPLPLQRTVYLRIIKQLKKRTLQKTVTGIGDEATWFQTNGQNLYSIMERKGNKMIRMKVNKATANTSLDAFKAVAKEVSGRM